MEKSRNSRMAISNIVGEDHQYESPVKFIKTINDMKAWDKSEAYSEYLGFVLAVNDAVRGKSNMVGGAQPSEEIMRLLQMLDRLDDQITRVPPIDQPQRFGNQAFRTWYQKLKEGAIENLQTVVPENLFRAVPEIMVYLVEGFGNPSRIDYGTGHEISFLMFLCCLFKIGFLHEDDKVTVGCKVFPRYLEVVRRLQIVYRMEPAGSRGVWSLDDHQFVPFIWGSSQLIGQARIDPSMSIQKETLDEFGNDYLYLGCIQHIMKVKSGPFDEHSNQLWGISSITTWSKINGGLIKMYKAEVLGKFPVVQHIVFGSLLTLKPAQAPIGPLKLNLPPPDPKVDDHEAAKDYQPNAI